MSVTKRDNYEFRHASAAAQAAPRPQPRQAESPPERAVRMLALQGSWNDGTVRGGDPYNSTGPRTRR